MKCQRSKKININVEIEDMFVITYCKLNNNSSMLISKTKDGKLIVINEYKNKEADKLYSILYGNKEVIEDLERLKL